jgi:hypothetical protein
VARGEEGGDVAKGCLKALWLYKDRLDVLYGVMKETTRAAERLRFEAFNQLAPALQRFLRRYRQGRERVLADCGPR